MFDFLSSHSQKEKTLRVMTLNLGGGTKNFDDSPETKLSKNQLLKQLIDLINPDLIGFQEISQYLDADGGEHSTLRNLKDECGFDYYYYGETLSARHNMLIAKDLMINALFADWYDWSKGNALLSRYKFARLSDPNLRGEPRNLPVFQPLAYEGTRNTDPRFVILTRLMVEPYPYILNLHLTTLTGERGPKAWKDVIDAAQLARSKQINRVMTLIEKHILEPELPVILMGDFNAQPDEYTIKEELIAEHGFKRLIPEKDIPTHENAGIVDHIFVSPAKAIKSYTCTIVDNELARQATDHLPVVADIHFN